MGFMIGNHRRMRTLSLLVLLFMMGPGWAGNDLASLRADAARGDPWAQLNLGAAYDNGLGVAPDAAQALHWYRRAAEQGVAQAQFNLGHSYAVGHGMAQNYTEAVRWLTLAARQGLVEAQHLLAVCYREGLGVTADRDAAQRWLTRAAAQHYQPAIDYARRHHITLGEPPP